MKIFDLIFLLNGAERIIATSYNFVQNDKVAWLGNTLVLGSIPDLLVNKLIYCNILILLNIFSQKTLFQHFWNTTKKSMSKFFRSDMKKINVLHLCDKLGRSGSSIHGVSQLFSWWWPLFDQDRFEVELLVLRGEEKSSQALRDKGVPHRALQCGKFNFFSYRQIATLIKQNHINILHAHGYGAANIGVFAAKKMGIPSIVHEHFVDSAYPVYQKPFDFFLARKADKGIAVSQCVKEFMSVRRCIPRAKIEVIYNGAPLENINLPDEQAVVIEKKRLGIPADRKVIATIGRIDEEKGNYYFLKSAKTLLKRGFKVHFVLFGDGPLLPVLKQQSLDEGIANHVTFTGYYTNITLAHSMIDVQVFPSLSEGAPLTMFEAFSFGTPIVSTNVGGLGELLRDEETALLMSAKDDVKMTELIARILEDELLRQQLAVAAKEEGEKYNVMTGVRRMEELYIELCSC